MITLQELEESGECCYDSKNCCEGNFAEVPEVGRGLITSSSIAMSFPFASTDNQRDSRVAIGQLPSFDRTFTSKSAPSQVIWKDISRVVAPGNGGGPSMDSLAESMNIHRVSRVDFVNLCPIESMSAKWVNDCELTGCGSDLGHDQNEMIAVTEKGQPSKDRDCTRSDSLVNFSDCESTKKEIVGASEDEVASRSDLMAFAHFARITSWEVTA